MNKTVTVLYLLLEMVNCYKCRATETIDRVRTLVTRWQLCGELKKKAGGTGTPAALPGWKRLLSAGEP